jgi:hypothetical protein
MWQLIISLTPSDKNMNNPRVDGIKLVFHKLHIKLGLMRRIIKALDHIGDWESKVNTFVQEIKIMEERYHN